MTLFASFRKCSFLLVAALPLAADGLFHACRAQEPRLEVRYPHGPDSFQQDGVPRGKVTEYVWNDSKVFPGTIRR
ncbi:MAG TPA: hypothetical protein VJ828_11095, partial [Lacipirellulaceae bacterium]|nr:hypothetical protein [Lacipirellulaceae bacterium]